MTSEDYSVLFLATIADLVLEVLSIVLFLQLFLFLLRQLFLSGTFHMKQKKPNTFKKTEIMRNYIITRSTLHHSIIMIHCWMFIRVF